MNAARIEQLVAPVLDQEAVELVDLRFVKEGPRWVLRFFIDKEGGITLEDCAYLSDRIGSLLDSSGAVERSYVLEVSSPGIDRIIKTDKDFDRFSGRPVRLRLKLPEQGQRNFRGVLKGLSEGKVLVDCGGEVREFKRESLDEVRLDEAAAL